MSKVWKWLFLGLLALNLALISVVTVRIMTPVEMSPVSLPKGAAKIGKYSMSKEELDATLRGFAQDYSTDKMRFKVKVTNSKIVFECAKKGDPTAIEVFRYTGQKLGEALANFVMFSSPEAILLFGGVIKAGDFILKPTKIHMERNLLPIFRNKVRLVFSELDEADAAILGASALVWEK